MYTPFTGQPPRDPQPPKQLNVLCACSSAQRRGRRHLRASSRSRVARVLRGQRGQRPIHAGGRCACTRSEGRAVTWNNDRTGWLLSLPAQACLSISEQRPPASALLPTCAVERFGTNGPDHGMAEALEVLCNPYNFSTRIDRSRLDSAAAEGGKVNDDVVREP